MTKEELNNLNWKIYHWMITEHFIPNEQLVIFAFIYEFSGNEDIATYENLKELFVYKNYSEEMLKFDISCLTLKNLIDEQKDATGKKIYSVVEKHN